jgi:hypothetical protein
MLQTDKNTTEMVVFHPHFPNYWRICVSQPIRAQRQLPTSHDEKQDYTSRYALSSHEGEEMEGDEYMLIPDQIITGTTVTSSLSGSNTHSTWIRISKNGWYISRFAVTPYTPTYRVIADTHTDSDGVAPYVLPTINQERLPPNCVFLPTLFVEQPLYDPNSPFCRPDMKQPIGTVFAKPSLLISRQQER